jgi:hypothetical protein
VVSIAAIKKRGFLRQIAEGAKVTSSTLRAALLASQKQIFTANFQRGRILVSTSGSGQSGNFEIGVQGKEFTQDNVFAMVEEFLEILDDLIAAGATDTADSASTDTLFTSMCDDDRLRGARSQYGDFSQLRCEG